MSLISSELFKLAKDKLTSVLVLLLIPFTIIYLVFQPASEMSITHGFNPSIAVINIIVIILASRLVALEFERETVKSLFMQPASRAKIIYAKYIAMVLFILAAYLVFLVSATAGAIFFEDVTVSYEWGIVYKMLETFIIGSGTYLLAIIFKSSSISLTCSFLLLLIGEKTMSFVSQYVEIGSYSIFLNQDLSVYQQPVNPELIPMGVAVGIILIHLVMYHAAMVYLIKTMDV